MKSLKVVTLCLLTASLIQDSFAAARFRVLPALQRNGVFEPFAVSDGGRVTVGAADNRDLQPRPVWRQLSQGTREILPNQPGQGYAQDVSSDGSVIVGRSQSTAGSFRAFCWNRHEGFFEINPDADIDTDAYGVSGDGRVIVGSFRPLNPVSTEKAFRWSANLGFEPLDDMGGTSAFAAAASHSGTIIVGSVTPETGPWRACRWLTNGQAELLGTLGGLESNAWDVSPDGTVIVGAGQIDDQSYHAFRWTLFTGMQRFDTNQNYILSSANAISTQGYIVGSGTENNRERAFLWTPQDGLRELDQAFASILPKGWSFVTANDISSDGRWIVGTVLSPRRGIRGYILDTGRDDKSSLGR